MNGAQQKQDQSIAWAVWDTPERVVAHPAITNETGDAQPRLVLITYERGTLKIAATRRPPTILSDAARIARAAHTWIDSVLVSEPDVKLSRIRQMLVKRLLLGGRRYIGGGMFERLAVEEVLAVLAQIRPIAEPPEDPRTLSREIPLILRKGVAMQAEESTRAGLPSLVVANTAIQQDREGRYCLNDLHRAAGGEKRHQPSNWLRSDQTKELIEELKAEITDPQIRGTAKNQPVTTYQGGNDIQGTYVCKELVYAYAMWISPKFHLAVIRAFDALVSGRKPEVGHQLPPEVGEAIEFRAWREADWMRRLLLSRLNPEDPVSVETSWTIGNRVRVEAARRLAEAARGHLAKGVRPEKVAAWMETANSDVVFGKELP